MKHLTLAKKLKRWGFNASSHRFIALSLYRFIVSVAQLWIG
jgi:hypothetical protein